MAAAHAVQLRRRVWRQARGVGGGKYVNDVERIDGKWLFKRVRLNSIMWTPFDQGWELDRFIDEGPHERGWVGLAALIHTVTGVVRANRLEPGRGVP